MSNSKVLCNAGISKGEVTNSDKYLALRLNKEFDAVISSLELKSDQKLGKSALFDILVKLNLLK